MLLKAIHNTLTGWLLQKKKKQTNKSVTEPVEAVEATYMFRSGFQDIKGIKVHPKMKGLSSFTPKLCGLLSSVEHKTQIIKEAKT